MRSSRRRKRNDGEAGGSKKKKKKESKEVKGSPTFDNGEFVCGRVVIDFFKPVILRRWRKSGSLMMLLSHYHTDHTGSLSPNWKRRIVFCSEDTGVLLEKLLGVEKHLVNVFEFDKPIFNRTYNGFFRQLFLGDIVNIVPLRAGHIKGSSMFLVRRIIDGRLSFSLYTCDFRYDEELRKDLRKKIQRLVPNRTLDHLFLDCTNSKHLNHIPSRKRVSNVLTSAMKKIWKLNPNSTFLIRTYNSGRDILIEELADQLDDVIFCHDELLYYVELTQGYDFVEENFSNEYKKHGVNLIGKKEFQKMLGSYKNILENNEDDDWTFLVIPTCLDLTGNRFSIKRLGINLFVWRIPYTDHSSIYELKLLKNDVKANFCHYLESTNEDVATRINRARATYDDGSGFLKELRNISSKEISGFFLPDCSY